MEVEVFKIKADKARIATQQNTSNDNFDEIKSTGWRTYISGVANLTTCDGDACLIGILFMRFDLVDNHGVANLSSSVLGDILKLDEAEVICAFHSFVLGVF